MTRNLESRKAELKLEDKLGKIQTVTKETTKENEAGYTCEVCNCVMKDSQTYLDHINGKKRKKKRQNIHHQLIKNKFIYDSLINYEVEKYKIKMEKLSVILKSSFMISFLNMEGNEKLMKEFIISFSLNIPFY